MNRSLDRSAHTEWQLAFKPFANGIKFPSLQTQRESRKVTVVPRALKHLPVSENRGKRRLNPIVHPRFPRTEMVKLPLCTGVTLSVVTLPVGEIGEVDVFQEMDRTKFTITPVVLLSGDDQHVLDQPVGPI